MNYPQAPPKAYDGRRDRRSCLLCTAGHIDHGKSSLVKALTGTDPDRLPEEQARGMTIELGYAHLRIPSGVHPVPDLVVGIVDVPGHERFVRTMVAGATGVEMAMLVVAADDGVMPQTREHVDILDLLGLHAGLVVLTKIDLVGEHRLDEVRGQIAELTAGTALAGWPVLPCSARTEEGLSFVQQAIIDLALALPVQEGYSCFRLAIDRVFPIPGRGTVVTGSVLAGSTERGRELELLPPGLRCKVREVQSYGEKVDGAWAGRRAALNLTGIDRDKIERGMELAAPDYLVPSRYVDARVRILPRRKEPFVSHQRVRVCMGTAETMASMIVVGGGEIPPGQQALVQLRLHRQVVCTHLQPFILRTENAQATLGGGRIIRPVSRRLRQNHPDELESLRRAASDDPAIRCDEALRRGGFSYLSDEQLAREIGGLPWAAGEIRTRLANEGRMVFIPLLAAKPTFPQYVQHVHRAAVESIQQRALAYLKRYHAQNPSEPGILRDRLVGWLEARSAPRCGRYLLQCLEQEGRVQARGPYVAAADFRPALSTEEALLLERLVREVSAARFDPPVLTSLPSAAGLSRQRLKLLEDIAKTEPRLVGFAPQQFISAEALEEVKAAVRRLGEGRPFKLADVRDALGLSRRVVQPLLEHLDRVGFTRRVGDERVLVEGRR